jgi:hypothetical protein
MSDALGFEPDRAHDRAHYCDRCRVPFPQDGWRVTGLQVLEVE